MKLVVWIYFGFEPDADWRFSMSWSVSCAKNQYQRKVVTHLTPEGSSFPKALQGKEGKQQALAARTRTMQKLARLLLGLSRGLPTPTVLPWVSWFQCKFHGLMATQANLMGSPLRHVNIYKWYSNGASDTEKCGLLLEAVTEFCLPQKRAACWWH